MSRQHTTLWNNPESYADMLWKLANESFQYDRLDTTSKRHAIRLLKVLPSEDDAPLTCELVHADTTREYTALSYMWGPTIPQYTIRLQNESSHGFVSVRKQLFEFLTEMEHRGSDSSIWIDALCIDQENVDERNHQVRQMGNIYRSAKTVLVWLGCDVQLAELFDIFANHSFKVSDPKHSWSTKLAAKAATIFRGGKRKPSYIENLRRSTAFKSVKWTIHHPGMIQLCEHPYWTRVWIRQEFTLATEMLFLCRNTTISLVTLNAI